MKFIYIIILFTFFIKPEENNNFFLNKQDNELLKSIKRGKEIYIDMCVNCHLPNGKGVPKVFPPLANADFLIKNREASIKAIKYGIKGKIKVNGKIYNGIMAKPGLDDDEVADVMNYINNSWGNKNSKIVTLPEVKNIKK